MSYHDDLLSYAVTIQQRTPHPARKEGKITLTWTDLSAQMKCPICLSLMQDTVSTLECLHRFCSECISKSLRYGNKECPTCRKPCPSRRSLRKDANFDKLITEIYPDKDAFESAQQELLAKIQQYNNAQALVDSVREGVKLQAQSRKTHVRLASVVGRFETQGEYHNNVESEAPSQTRPSSPPPAKRQRTHSSPGMQRDDSASSATSSKSSGILELILEPHPEAYDVPALERKFLATDLGCSVAHLDRYLQTQFSNLEPPPGKSR